MVSNSVPVIAWHADRDTSTTVTQATHVDLYVRGLRQPFVRINFAQGRLQILDDGCVVDEAAFDADRLFELVRRGLPVVPPADEPPAFTKFVRIPFPVTPAAATIDKFFVRSSTTVPRAFEGTVAGFLAACEYMTADTDARPYLTAMSLGPVDSFHLASKWDIATETWGDWKRL